MERIKNRTFVICGGCSILRSLALFQTEDALFTNQRRHSYFALRAVFCVYICIVGSDAKCSLHSSLASFCFYLTEAEKLVLYVSHSYIY
jgi:hypothetical protein